MIPAAPLPGTAAARLRGCRNCRAGVRVRSSAMRLFSGTSMLRVANGDIKDGSAQPEPPRWTRKWPAAPLSACAIRRTGPRAQRPWGRSAWPRGP